MGIVVGLDIGGSTTKIVQLEDGQITACHLVTADAPVTSAYGALGKLLNQPGGASQRIGRIQLTGVGQSWIREEMLGIRAWRVDEIEAIGHGGLWLSGLEEAIVVSMGTGTAVVRASQGAHRRLFGSGVGGGTLLGLARSLIGTRDFARIDDLASGGSLDGVDLTVGDIAGRPIAGLASEVTASNFGRVQDDCRPEDLALGILNLVYQTVGSFGALAARQEGLSHCVFTGNLSQSANGRRILSEVCALYGIESLIPERAEYATSIGAALALGEHEV